MKSAAEWLRKGRPFYGEGCVTLAICDQVTIEKIQLEAMKKGMRRAAMLASSASYRIAGSQLELYIKQDCDKLTEKNLHD